MLTPYVRLRIKQILPFGLIWLVFGLIFTLLEKGLLGELKIYPSTGNPYEFHINIFITTLGSMVLGWIFGTIEILFINQLFKRRSFGYQLLFKSTLYVTFSILFLLLLTFVSNSIRFGLPVYHPEVTQSIINFYTTFAFWSVIIYICALIIVSVFVSEVMNNMGHDVLKHFISGTYHQPKEEERVFMFLDLKSSTTIAEQIGHIKYFRLLNKFYEDISRDIIRYEGEIYQYVGDEVVVTWKLKKGLRNQNCLKCFFSIKKTIRNLSQKYEKEFGLAPSFKAGIHLGQVTTGEIGSFKREIVFSGDVLNTTARIQSLCNELGTDLLVSEDLLNSVDLPNDYEVSERGNVQLRGKNKAIELFSVLGD